MNSFSLSKKISTSKKSFWANYLIIMSWFNIPTIFGKIGDQVSINWLYHTFILIITFFLTLFSKNSRINLKSPLKTYILFLVWLTISILWSYSPIDSLRYINKLFITAILSLYLSNFIEANEYYFRRIIISIVLFTVINYITDFLFRETIWKYPYGQYFEGLSGRHQIKYYASFSLLFTFFAYIFLKKRFYLLLLIALAIMLYLIFQRGVFLGILVGLAVSTYILYRGNLRFKIYYLLLISALFFIFTYILFYTEKGVSYMFYNEYQRDQFLKLIFVDPFYAINYIDFKGRLEYWGVLMENRSFFYGIGFGSVGKIIEETFGVYNELHNDWLQFYVELGVPGVLLYFLFWVSYFKKIKELIRVKHLDNYNKIFLYTGLSYGVYITVNGFFDHVIDYPSISYSLSLILAYLMSKK